MQVLDAQAAEAMLSEAVDTTVFVYTFCLTGATLGPCADAVARMQCHYESAILGLAEA
tara:strand:+ start:1660 stop:1833 length:174 start_codon:yes stop_codon:yes gene_type:complete